MSINSFSETQPYALNHVLSVVAFMLKWHGRVVAAPETVRPAKSKVFPIWPFEEILLTTDLGPCYPRCYLSADPRNMLEMQNLGHLPELWTQQLHFNKSPLVIYMFIKPWVAPLRRPLMRLSSQTSSMGLQEKEQALLSDRYEFKILFSLLSGFSFFIWWE